MYRRQTSESEVISVCDDQVAAGRLPPSAPLWGPPPPVPSRLPSVQPSDTGAPDAAAQGQRQACVSMLAWAVAVLVPQPSPTC
jgi:hypothetical protein